MANKDKAIVDFLMQCPQVKAHPLFFNFAEAKDNTKQFVTVANDKVINRPFIDGSVLKRFTFTIIDFRSVIYQPLVVGDVERNENVEEFIDVQSILDWVEAQEDVKNYPNFGEGYQIEEMHCVTDTANLNGIDTNVTPALAKYSFSIQIEYLDKTKMIWS